ncbi:MAG: hypothetical protein LKJ71_11055, partial [Acetobacter peroxydans]|nr:hypothetical protein [Acetobacter peroxydans]
MFFLFSLLTGEACPFIFSIQDQVQYNEQQKSEHDLAAQRHGGSLIQEPETGQQASTLWLRNIIPRPLSAIQLH